MTAGQVHPIEAESYRRLRKLVDTAHLPPLSRAVAERIVHATGDPSFIDDLVLDEDALAAGAAALAAGAPLVVDVRMVAAGITSRATTVALAAAGTQERAAADGSTRSAAGMRLAAAAAGPGAVYAIGCAPTALDALVSADAAPALVVGLPVGFVGAVESKSALRASGLPAVSNRSLRGGSAAAAAAVNALLYARRVS